MEKELWTAGILIFGGWAVCLGVMVRIGKWRTPLMYQGFPVLASPGAFLIAVPIGLGFIIIGLEIVFPDINLTILGLVLFFATIILGFWMPNWLFPKWFQWLMKNYEPVLGKMLEEARQMGIKEWEKHTRTQEGLERWADSVAKKHGWQRSNNKS